MIYYRKNFGSGKLQSAIGTGDLTVVFQAGHTFPTNSTQYFKLIIWNQLSFPNPANDPYLEIVTAHYLSGNTYAIARAEESTIARSHASGDTASLTLTAGLSSDDLYVVGSARVDETNIGGGKVLVSDTVGGIRVLKYAIGTGMGDMLTSYWDANGDGKIDDDKVSVSLTSLGSGTPSSSNFLRGDGQWVPSIVTGMILMWSGTIATIPTGWVLCDGNNSTPDLRDRFIVGASADDGGVAKTNVTGSLTQSGDGSVISHTHVIKDSSGVTIYKYSGSGNLPSERVLNGTSTNSLVNPITVLETNATGGTKNIAVYYALAYIMKT